MFSARRIAPKSKSPARPPRSRIEGTVYAIGDIHGRLDLFERLIGEIRADAAEFSHENGRPTVVLLGDLIDRGPASAECLERAIVLAGETWCDIECIKGNHEEALELFLEDPGVGPNWTAYGGGETLLSYGVDVSQASPAKGWAGIQADFKRVLPTSHLAFVQGMRLWLERDDYIFVHAGVRPGLPMERQSQTDLLWIRQGFREAEQPYPDKVIVHGHTPTPEPELKRWRIGIDTGAYASGVLTAIRLRGFERSVIQVK